MFYPFKNQEKDNSDKKYFKKSCQKIWWNKKMVVTLHSQTGNNNPEMFKYSIGAVVQLVRIHACHAWGRGFESRPHR